MSNIELPSTFSPDEDDVYFLLKRLGPAKILLKNSSGKKSLIMDWPLNCWTQEAVSGMSVEYLKKNKYKMILKMTVLTRFRVNPNSIVA